MFEALISAGLDRGIQIKMVENAVAKDKVLGIFSQKFQKIF